MKQISYCRACGKGGLHRVLDLGTVPAADDFPLASEPVDADETSQPLAMDLCTACGLAQLAEDGTVPAEPRGVEPRALIDQGADAVRRVAEAGWLRGATVWEFGSPHGGTWLPLLAERGFQIVDGLNGADLVVDSFGIMHERDQHAAFQRRAAMTLEGGVLLLQFHSLATIVALRQWNSLRHGHFAYYSMTALQRLLESAGMSAVSAWEFDLYGGTVLVAAVHGRAEPDQSVQRILASEIGMTDPEVVSALQQSVSRDVAALQDWLARERDAGRRVYAYGAASRAVSLFTIAGVNEKLINAVADASPSKQGRRMPGTDVKIVSPAELITADPDRVLLTLPDLLPEVAQQFPELSGRWVIDDPDHGLVRAEA
jgi:C-methyltransferase C-terminal domain/Putative zinc binding domain/Methyltransferase domain